MSKVLSRVFNRSFSVRWKPFRVSLAKFLYSSSATHPSALALVTDLDSTLIGLHSGKTQEECNEHLQVNHLR